MDQLRQLLLSHSCRQAQLLDTVFHPIPPPKYEVSFT